jgi:hypothetical protein
MNTIEKIFTLSNNPIFDSRIVLSFLGEYTKKSIVTKYNFFKLYLILPFVLYGPIREKLINANKKSSLRTLFFTNKNDYDLLSGINKRFFYFQKLFNNSLIIAINEELIEVHDNLNICITPKGRMELLKPEINKSIHIKAAKNLAKVFSKIKTLDIYKLLRIKKV